VSKWSPRWVNSVDLAVRRLLPVFPNKQTFLVYACMSQTGQQATWARIYDAMGSLRDFANEATWIGPAVAVWNVVPREASPNQAATTGGLPVFWDDADYRDYSPRAIPRRKGVNFP
jgi:hypothetical protein